MANETKLLAAYAAKLRYEDIPAPVLRRAKDCLIDTLGVAFYGEQARWSGIIKDQARHHGGSGRARIFASDMPAVNAETAARANGVLAHATEMDSLRKPGAGVHPGAVLVPAALAAAQERDADGKALLTAFVAGCEAMFRIGRATHHSAEGRGFHAPGLTGPFGAAAAAGSVFGLNADGMTNAFGIAGSLCGGLMQFAAGEDGGMVKKLHIGRAAENGIVAARLAEAGYEGPSTILEGRFGFLASYCAQSEPEALIAKLGEEYETLNICFKRYPCHITAHTPVHAIELLREKHGFNGGDVMTVVVDGAKRIAEFNGNQNPVDLAMATYSIPYCVAIALLRDTSDPDSFDEAALHDPAMRDLRQRISVVSTGGGGHSDWTTTTRVALKDGRSFEQHQSDYPGTPTSPLTGEQLEKKFFALTKRLGPAAKVLYQRLNEIENETHLAWLQGPGAH
ncbi:MAG: MmgE/PrpD family protein [Burkholderiales bacterium]